NDFFIAQKFNTFDSCVSCQFIDIFKHHFVWSNSNLEVTFGNLLINGHFKVTINFDSLIIDFNSRHYVDWWYSEEAGYELISWMFINLSWCTNLLNLRIVKYHNVISHSHCFNLIMGNID